MSSQDPPKLRQTNFADYSTFFSKDQYAGQPNPWYRGFKVLMCKNCGQFISEDDASHHDKWHASGDFEQMYREKVLGRPIENTSRTIGRKVA
ncbi:MAG: hypothetical protein V3W28_06530 [Thermoplasmata archaeon]